jgi:hypothetical protein
MDHEKISKYLPHEKRVREHGINRQNGINTKKIEKKIGRKNPWKGK